MSKMACLCEIQDYVPYDKKLQARKELWIEKDRDPKNHNVLTSCLAI
jgi:hypothetical protein